MGLKGSWREERILIVGKTYPNPSKKYHETACIGGITKESEWIRIYPVPFRYMERENKFRKFDIVTAQVCPHGDVHGRRESHKVRYHTIKTIEHMDAGSVDNWKKRNALVLPLLDESLESLMHERDTNNKSMGLIKVKKENLIDFIKEDKDIESDIDPQSYKTVQLTLSGSKITPLELIPYKMKLHFKCNGEDCNGHKISCFDWEMMQLFRDERDKLGDPDAAFEKVKEKIEWIFNERDPYLFLGTEYRYNNFIIGGIYYPPKEAAPDPSLMKLDDFI